jgi:hypothetical protein
MLADRVRMGSKIESGVRFLFFYDWWSNPVTIQIKNTDGEVLAELSEEFVIDAWNSVYGGYFNCEIGVDYILDSNASVLTPGVYVKYNNGGKSFTVMQWGSYRGSPAFMTIPKFDYVYNGIKFRLDYLPSDWDGVSPFVLYVEEQD